VVFDFAFGNVKPEFPPVAPFIAGAGNQLHDFHRSLAGLRRKRARSKLCNLMSNFPLLPMQTIMFCEDFHRGLPAIRSCHPYILCQGHHNIRRQLVDLDLESTKDLHHESMRRQTKASSEKGFKDDQLPFRLEDLLRPWDMPHSAAKISKLLHVLHVDRGHPRHAEFHCVTRMQLLRRHVAQCILGRCAGRRCRQQKRTTWLRTVGGGGRSASHEPDLRRAGARRAGERSNGFKRRLGFCGAQKEYLTHAAPPPFIHRTRCFGKPAIQQCRGRQRSHQKPPRNHFERGQRLHHLATPSAPNDLVELVPRRENVGAKAKTPPFARCLRRSRRTNGGKAAGSFHPSSNTLQDEGLRRGRSASRPRPTRRPM
jgi:hypothetical protein